MSKFKAGDKVRVRNAGPDGYAGARREIVYYGASNVVYTLRPQPGSMKSEHVRSRELFDEMFELVPETFEVGLTYEGTGSGRLYDCLFVSPEGAAMLRYEFKGNTKYTVAKPEDVSTLFVEHKYV